MRGAKPKHPELRRRSTINQAERPLEEEGLAALPVDLETLAAARGILPQAKPDADAGVSGRMRTKR